MREYSAESQAEDGNRIYLVKPFGKQEGIQIIRQALAEQKYKEKLMEQLSGRPCKDMTLKEIMGPSEAVARLISEVKCVAESDLTVLIIGESGSGKEVIARAIHQASPRSKSPFVPVDCGSIPEPLLESELFGHEKGFFTDSQIQRVGKFEVAQGGTLFLDEIFNMPLSSQAKLLRVLQEKKVYRVGGITPLSVNVRLLVTSNQDLQDLAVSGSFRQDLLYRLSEFTISIPPLRERKEDIPYLAKRFLDSSKIELNKQIIGISEAALNVLLAYDWPGNVRQLRSVIRRAALLSDEMITEKHLEIKKVEYAGMPFTPRVVRKTWENFSLKAIVQEKAAIVEREVLMQVLKTTKGNKAKAARLLQIDYRTIHEKMKKLGIQKKVPSMMESDKGHFSRADTV